MSQYVAITETNINNDNNSNEIYIAEKLSVVIVYDALLTPNIDTMFPHILLTSSVLFFSPE